MSEQRSKGLFVVAVLGGAALFSGFASFVLDLSHEVDQLRVDNGVLAAQLENEGIEPAVPDAEPVPGIPGEKGDQGERGERGPAGETVVGPPGPAGKDGASVVGPQGEKGDRGQAGEDGADSTVPGPAGTDGQPGADGRGIVSQDCVDGDLVTTYTDGSQGTIEDSPACPNGPPVTLLP